MAEVSVLVDVEPGVPVLVREPHRRAGELPAGSGARVRRLARELLEREDPKVKLDVELVENPIVGADLLQVRARPRSLEFEFMDFKVVTDYELDPDELRILVAKQMKAYELLVVTDMNRPVVRRGEMVWGTEWGSPGGVRVVEEWPRRRPMLCEPPDPTDRDPYSIDFDQVKYEMRLSFGIPPLGVFRPREHASIPAPWRALGVFPRGEWRGYEGLA